ncbi:MAG: sulfatase-like hydrolase/transferase, partial [Prolixibacteraceae bacterium]
MLKNNSYMNKYWFFIFVLTASLSCSQSNPDESTNPNVVIIMADDMGIGDVEAYNPESKIPTPNMNTLAEEGMRFTNA